MELKNVLNTLIDLLKSITISDQALDDIQRLYLIAAENASDITRRDFCYSVARTAEQLFISGNDSDLASKNFTCEVHREHNTWYIEVKAAEDEYPLWSFYVEDVAGNCTNLEAVEKIVNNVLMIQDLGRKPKVLFDLSNTITAIVNKYAKMQQQETDWAMHVLP